MKNERKEPHISLRRHNDGFQIRNEEHNTYPSVIHAPGWTLAEVERRPEKHREINPSWQRILDLWKNNVPLDRTNSNYSNETVSDLAIISWSNANSKGYLEKSLERLRCSYHIVGKHESEWSNRFKLTLVLDYIESIDAKFVLGLDSFDVLVLAHPSNIIQIFKEQFYQEDGKMLFNSERYFYPDCGRDETGKPYLTTSWRRFQKEVCSEAFRFLNAGAYIAERKFLVDILNEALSIDVAGWIEEGQLPERKDIHETMLDNDQAIMHHLYKKHYPSIRVDSTNEIFLNLLDVEIHSVSQQV